MPVSVREVIQRTLHRSGRTRRMLCHAIALASAGRDVRVYAASERAAAALRAQFVECAVETVNTADARAVLHRVRVVVMTGRTSIDEILRRARSPSVQEVVLIDHAAIETALADVLDELHRWDSPVEGITADPATWPPLDERTAPGTTPPPVEGLSGDVIPAPAGITADAGDSVTRPALDDQPPAAAEG